MPTDANLAATIGYLRFPLRVEHRAALCDGSHCPHCDGVRIQKWGRFLGRAAPEDPRAAPEDPRAAPEDPRSARQRFRCLDCGRTFSTFTRTPLRYLKRPQRWRGFLWCTEGRLTLRRTAAVLGIDKDTALRWRHRLLDHWRREGHPRLRGRISVGEFTMPLNEKGSRRLRRAARRHSEPASRKGPEAELVPLVAAVQEDGRDLSIQRITRLPPGRADYASVLVPLLGHVEEVASWRGPLCPLAAFAREMGATYRIEQRAPRETNLFRLRRELRRWLRPLYGVATRRLENYLEWFRRDRPVPMPP